MKLTISQQKIIKELGEGKVIIERELASSRKGAHKFEYETAYISKDCPFGSLNPRHVRKESVWGLLELGLIKEEPLPWQTDTRKYKQYVLEKDKMSLLEGKSEKAK